MKKLEGLNEPVVTFAETPVTYPELDKEGKPITSILTRKLAIINCLGSMKVDNGIKAIQVYSIGTLLYKAEDSFNLKHEDELDLLKDAVEQNVPGYVPFIQGQLLEYLKK
jgi:hypothetical protein